MSHSPPAATRRRCSALARRAKLWVFAVASLAPLHGQAPRVTTPAPVKNYSVSFFSDEGYHNMHVRGTTADLSQPDHVQVTGLALTVFTGDESRRVETVILSPQAVLQPKVQQVAGPGSVRLIRDDLEVSGEDWNYEHASKKILIRRDARIVFQTALADLLK